MKAKTKIKYAFCCYIIKSLKNDLLDQIIWGNCILLVL